MFKRNFKKFATSSLIALILASCADLSVENLNAPNESDVITDPTAYIPLLQGSYDDAFYQLNGFEGILLDGQADYMTTTNRSNGFWDFSFQPRMRVNNTTGYAYAFVMNNPWLRFYSAIGSANDVIRVIQNDNQTIVVDGVDLTQKYLAAAYFLRGVSTGYLGMLYDQALILDENSGVVDPSPYADVIEASIADLQRAITTAEGASNFDWDLLPTGESLDLAAFRGFANSFAARILIGKARTDAEAKALPTTEYDRIIAFAKAGAGQGAAGVPDNYLFSTVTPYVFYHDYADWSGYYIAANDGYLPVDVRVMQLLQRDYLGTTPPFDFIVTRDGDGNLLPMAEMVSDDPRTEYFWHSETFGFLSQSRDLRLFTSYQNNRIYGDNDWGGYAEFPVPFFIKAEMEYILAEAEFRKGNKVAAAGYLNASPFGTGVTDLTPFELPAVTLEAMSEDGLSGGYEISTTAPDAAFVYALQKEQAVELTYFANMASNLIFMRRHDLLQTGTPLHWPVPAATIEIVATLSPYSFGGESDVATGTADWRLNLYDNTGITKLAPKSGRTNFVAAPKVVSPRLSGNGKARSVE